MRLFRLLAFTTFACSITATAQQATLTLNELAVSNVQMVTCPSIGEDFSQLLTRLDALKATIKKGANCKDIDTTITTKFDGVTKMRDRFLELIKKSQTDTLTEAEIKEIGTYADQITSKVGSIMDLFTNANSCFEDDADKKALASLSGFVSEAATLLSQVSGPWGAPIAIGGQVLSGFISGLDKIMKSRAGIDFSDRTQWVAYVQNLCTYHAIRQNIDGLLHPQERISTLRAISNKLDMNMTAIASVCPECGEVAAMPQSQVHGDAKVQSIDARYVNPMGSLSARVRNAQSWVKGEISRISTESNSYLSNVTGKDALMIAKQDLESFLIEKEAPKFLDYQYSQSMKAFQDLRMFLFSDGSNVLHQAFTAKLLDKEPAYDKGYIYYGYGFGAPTLPGDQVSVFKALTNNDWRAKYKSLGKSPDDLGFRLINARKTALDKFDAASWSYGVSYVFCDFFQQVDLYPETLQSACSSARAKALNSSIADLATVMPEWEPSVGGLRAADWTSVLIQWSDQVQAVVSAADSQLR